MQETFTTIQQLIPIRNKFDVFHLQIVFYSIFLYLYNLDIDFSFSFLFLFFFKLGIIDFTFIRKARSPLTDCYSNKYWIDLMGLFIDLVIIPALFRWANT